MMRALLSSLVCLSLVGLAGADDKKSDTDKTNTVTGKFKEYKDGTLTILVSDKGDKEGDKTGDKSDKKGDKSDKKGDKGEEGNPQKFKVADDFKVTVHHGEDKKEVSAKEAFKDCKDGTPVHVKSTGDKVTAVTVGHAKKKSTDK